MHPGHTLLFSFHSHKPATPYTRSLSHFHGFFVFLCDLLSLTRAICMVMGVKLSVGSWGLGQLIGGYTTEDNVFLSPSSPGLLLALLGRAP